jgi:hypothetical protein
VISFAELRQLVDEAELLPIAIAEDLMSARFTHVSEGETLYDALEKLERARAEALPVLSVPDERFLGMLTRSGAYSVVTKRLASVRKDLLREHTGLAAIEEQSQLAHLVAGLPAAETTRIDHVPVAAEWIGRSLREIDFRKTRGATVLAVQTADRKFVCPPDPNRALAAGDRLVVMSEGEATAAQA